MALVVYDQGYRIQTPVSALFKPRGTEELTEPKASPSLPHSDDIARDEAQQLEQQFRSQQTNARRLPASRSHPEPNLPRQAKRYLSQDRRKHGLTARQLMVSPVYTVRENTPLREAWGDMQAYGIHHLVVVDEELHILGLLSDTECLAYGHNSPVAVAKAYQRKIVVASEDTELSVLANTFVTYPVRALPVVDSEERLAGIITRSDLLRLLINNARVSSWA